MSPNPSKTQMATVVRLLPMGARVRLEDGRVALLREREMGWDEETRRDWQAQLTVGKRFPVAVVKEDERGEIEVSKRLAEQDPWQTVAEDFPVGSAHVGVVTGIESYGVFVRLKPGVTGLLHREHWPAWMDRAENPSQYFWIGDAVYVEVLRIDRERRRIALGMENLHEHRWQGVVFDSKSSRSRPRVFSPLPLEAAATEALPAWRVLIVDDKGKKRQVIRRYLQQAGQDAYACATVEEARDLLETWKPHLALVDWHLEEGESGSRFVFELREKLPQAIIYLMSGDAPDATLSKRLREHRIGFLARPLRAEDIWEILIAARQLAASSEEQTAPSRPPISKQMARALHRLRRVTRGDDVILFRYEMERGVVEIESWIDRRGRPRHLSAYPNLLYSPVREVAETGEPLLEPDILTRPSRRFARLLELFKFRGCLGVRLPLPEAFAPHVLFLFYRYADRCDKETLLLTEAEAEALAWLIELEQQRTLLQRLQGLVLQGRTNRALVHEVNNQLDTVQKELESLLEMCALLDENSSDWDKRDVQESLANASKALSRLIDTTKAYKELTSEPTYHTHDVQELIERIGQLVEHEASRRGIELVYSWPKQPILIKLNEVAFQQILLNLLLNAVQQVEEQHEKGRTSRGRIWIALKVTEDEKLPVNVYVEDDGPGIHARWRQIIFRPGFSTRDGGTGLGLSISRDLAQRELKGELLLDYSAIGWGSRFSLRLPMKLSQS